MSVTREHPEQVFKTVDGRLFDNAEEAHCHERAVRLRGLVAAWFTKNSKSIGNASLALYANELVADIANHVACVVKDTPLANG